MLLLSFYHKKLVSKVHSGIMKYLGSNISNSDSFVLGSWEIKKCLGLNEKIDTIFQGDMLQQHP